jgi:RNA polymerase sigma factor (sigma-70 family)
MNSPLTDGQLLREFAVSRDERAFHELVRRHQDMVFSTALRRTGHHEVAADVAQNVFLALATKAAWLSTRSTVGGWLYKSTVLETARRQRDEARRSKREQRYAEETRNLQPDSNDMNEEDEAQRARKLMPLLDEAMSGLSDTDREALVLRFMRGLSLRDTGAALGTTEEAARKRVSRALEKLSGLFRRRGVQASVAFIAAALLPQSVKAAPLALTSKWAGAATLAPATGVGGSLVMMASALSKWQVITACVAVAAVPVSWQAVTIQNLKKENGRLSSLAASRVPAWVQPGTAQGLVDPAGLADAPQAAGAKTVAVTSKANREVHEQRKDWRGKFDQWRELQRQQQSKARLAALHEQIGLSDAQLTAIGEASAQAEVALHSNAEKKDPKAAAFDPGAITAARDQAIAAILDADQWKEYEAFCREEERSRREVMANRLLGDIQTTLHLSDTQKDQLFSLFASQPTVNGSLRREGPVEAMGVELTEKMAEVLSEEQFRLWRERTEMWSQFFDGHDKIPRKGP